MQPTGGTNHSSGALPPRQTWYTARRRLYASVFGVLAIVILVVLIVRWFVIGGVQGPWDLPLTLTLVAMLLTYTAMAWVHTKARLEADQEGLHLVIPLRRTTTYRWDDIAEIRPSIAKGKWMYLVLVRHNRQIVDLPVSEEHLDDLRRWHQAAKDVATGQGNIDGPQ